MIHENLKKDIQSHQKELVISDEYPLLNVMLLEDLSPILALEKTQNDHISDYPKFKYINYQMIAGLRLELHKNPSSDLVKIWCHKILRYIEIRYTILKSNEKKYNRSTKDSTLLFNQIFALFIEYYIHTHDLLYLNTALKINDLDWVFPIQQQKQMTTYLLYQLKKEQLDIILHQLEHE